MSNPDVVRDAQEQEIGGQVVLAARFLDLPPAVQAKMYRDWRSRRLALMDAEFIIMTGVDSNILRRYRQGL